MYLIRNSYFFWPVAGHDVEGIEISKAEKLSFFVLFVYVELRFIDTKLIKKGIKFVSLEWNFLLHWHTV